ncbi:MAG TPA: Flp family type IVb pilin [Candidatus Sulfotelmatobacter sp.]|nr:Flp family type IVb pilin [Candidatus Sulfotelmatobacter sp.]
MKRTAHRLWVRFQQNEVGQGLVEYALIMALISMAAVAGMKTIAGDINNAFVGIGNIFSTYVP